MAKREEKKVEEQPIVKPKIELKKFKLKDDYPPKKKGETIELSEEGEKLLKSKNLI